jgi:DNA polymerase III sliding clamp (beta) subunit (PCNA family)
LTATDLDNRLHISIPFVGEAIDSDVDALVPAKELCQLVKTESAPSLRIRIRNGKCDVSASKRTVVLSCADPNSFPETPDGELKPQGQILGSAFDAALRRTLFCVSTESGRYSTDVLKLELRGSVFRVVGTERAPSVGCRRRGKDGDERELRMLGAPAPFNRSHPEPVRLGG